MDRRFAIGLLGLLTAAGGARAQDALAMPTPPPLLTAESVFLPVGVTAPPILPANSPLPIDGCGGGFTCLPAPCGCVPCGPPGRFWFGAELLLWWQKGDTLPPLLTTSPPGTARTAAGVLGVPGTTTLFGGSTVNGDLRPGLRVYGGYWFDECQTCGIEGNFFFLGNRNSSLSAFSPGVAGSAEIARPFFNVTTGAQASELVAFPGVTAGAASVESHSSGLIGGGVWMRKNLCCDCCYRVDLLGGFRYLNLDDQLTVREALVASDPAGVVPVGTVLLVTDRFRTYNDFYGGDIGLAGEYRSGRWFAGGRGSVALGDSHQEVSIRGTTQVFVPGAAPVINLGGLLAQPTNIGTYRRDTFAVVPEVGVWGGYQVTPNVRAFVGYNFLYWSNVVRPGDAIDLAVNRTQIPPGTLVGPARPAFTFHTSDVWAQGVSLGLEFRY